MSDDAPVYAGPLPTDPECAWCGSRYHDRPERCPQVKAVDYHPDGSIARVEKREPGTPQYWPPITYKYEWPYIYTSGSSGGAYQVKLPGSEA